MVSHAVEHLAREVEGCERDVRSEDRVIKAAVEIRREGVFAGVTTRAVAAIVAESDRLGERHVQPQRLGDGASDLGDLEGVGESGALMIARKDEDLRLSRESAKGRGVKDPVAVALEAGPVGVGDLGSRPLPRADGTRRARRETSHLIELALLPPPGPEPAVIHGFALVRESQPPFAAEPAHRRRPAFGLFAQKPRPIEIPPFLALPDPRITKTFVNRVITRLRKRSPTGCESRPCVICGPCEGAPRARAADLLGKPDADDAPWLGRLIAPSLPVVKRIARYLPFPGKVHRDEQTYPERLLDAVDGGVEVPEIWIADDNELESPLGRGRPSAQVVEQVAAHERPLVQVLEPSELLADHEEAPGRLDEQAPKLREPEREVRIGRHELGLSGPTRADDPAAFQSGELPRDRRLRSVGECHDLGDRKLTGRLVEQRAEDRRASSRCGRCSTAKDLHSIMRMSICVYPNIDGPQRLDAVADQVMLSSGR